MKTNVQTLVILIFLVAIDQLSKAWMSQSLPALVVHNPGWIGGSFSQVSVLFRTGLQVGYFAGIVVLVTAFWNFWTDQQNPYRIAILFFLGGVTGNFIDRIRLGAAIDFIPIHAFGFTAVLNVADFFQWISLGCFLYALLLLKKDSLQAERRNRIFTDRRLQMKLFLKISLIMVGFVTAMNALIYIALTTLSTSSAHELLGPMIWISLCYGFLFEVILFLVVIRETHKWIGPVQAFLKYMLRSPRTQAFNLRRNDEFKELEQVAFMRSE